MRGAAGIGLGTTIKYLRRTTSAAANNDLSQVPCEINAGAGINWAKAQIQNSWARFLLDPTL
jgi:hypothetical protein